MADAKTKVVPLEPTEAMCIAMRKWENPILAWQAALSAAPQPAASDVPHDGVRALNCRDDAEPCPRCGCETQHMVRVVPLVAGGDRGEAVSCGDADCCFRGPVAADMHAAVSAWNVVAGFLATPAPSTSTEEALRAENARLRSACQRLDAYWLETFPEGPDGDVTYAKGLGRLADECIDLWRGICSALSR